jgi:ribonuclease E
MEWSARRGAEGSMMTESQKSERGGAKAEGKHEGKAEAKGPASQMLINYVPGEECRVAIVEDGKLEELHVERFSQASHVGSIYVGRVVNVEQAIQAAFVDFGMPENGFLHVTDLHPKYFPGEGDETTERVGFKTPRRERPPIQHALRRGDEVIVQVLKEGVGTKGPTVTSYLSIPGRFLVMMPGMDRVGVSRKVEDEEQRRKMREILDQLDLPEGFGFILRTAGFSRTKAELKRDLAYLMRLWKDMDRRLKTGGKPRLLYSESDLLVRSLRDLLSNEINEVVIDHDAAMRRAARFMKIVAPRTTTKLLHYPGTAPVFHAFGIEKQISLIHAREVPLPSGGRLVIDQTEALVAIDVNSGKSRDSRDSETNAYQTNLEAVDEICRQLRLRDMGGIVVNDLIDMRESRHRKDIENRVRDRLKRDRAKTTIGTISEFGILEMTRQRMRPSHESVHFTDCPMCRGRGMLQKPESVSADALRDLAAILDATRVSKVEMVVAPRVAGELLSNKRAMLGRIERRYGKHVDVRVSETVPADRVSFYAYDSQGADIDVGNLPQPRRPKDLVPWADLEPSAGEGGEGTEWTAADDGAGEPEDVVEDLPTHPIEIDDDEEYLGPVGTAPRGAAPVSAGSGAGKGAGTGQSGGRGGTQASSQGGEGEAGAAGEGGEGGGRRRRRRRRRGRGGQGGAGGDGAAEGAPGAAVGSGGAPGRANAGPGADGAARDVGDEGGGGDDGVDGEGGEGSEGPDGGGPRGEMRPPRLGPDGQPLPDGEGGGRRRRRRRRRGRGGQGGQGEQAGQGGQNVQGGQSVQPGQMNQGGHSAQAQQQVPSGGGRSGPRPDDRGRRGAPSDGGRPRLDASPETGGDWGDDGPIRIKPLNGTGLSAAGAMPGRDVDGSATGDDASGERADATVMPTMPTTPAAPLASAVTDELEAEAMADRAAMARSAPVPTSKPAGRGNAARAEAVARVAAAPDDGADGDADDGGDDGDGSDAGGGGAAGEGGEGGEAGDGTKRRRRRRRRRGRGGAGAAGGAGGEAGGDKPAGDAPSAALTPVQPSAPRAQTPPKAPVERAPRAESPRPDGGRTAREARPAPAPPAREVKPVAVTPPVAAAPKPRTLYGAVRRKLTPAELNKRPKPE